MGCIPRPGPFMSQAPLCEGFSGMCGSTPSLEMPQIFDTVDSDGTCPDQKDGHNGRVTARVGSNQEGRIVNGVWGPHLCFTHINSGTEALSSLY